AHAVQAEHRILEIVVVEILDRAAEANRLLGRPDGVGIEADAIARPGLGERAEAFELVVGMKDAALQLVRRETVLLLERLRVRDELPGGPDLASLVAGIAEEEIRRERHAIAERTA